MAEEKKTGFWSLIGKIATLAALSWTIISIVKYINEPKAGLNAQVRYGDFSMPPDLEAKHKKLREAMDPQNLEQHFIDSIDTVTENDRTKSYLYASSANKVVTSILGESFTSFLNRDARGVARITVSNTGSKTLSGTELRVPRMLSYQLERDGKSTFLESSDPISIDDIKPRETITIDCWLSAPLSEHSLDELAIVHNEGIAGIEYFIPTSNKSFSYFAGEWGWIFIPVILFGGLIFGISLIPTTEKPKSQTPEQANSEDDTHPKNQVIEQE